VSNGARAAPAYGVPASAGEREIKRDFIVI